MHNEYWQPLLRKEMKVHNTAEILLFAQHQMMTGEWTIPEEGMPCSKHCK